MSSKGGRATRFGGADQVEQKNCSYRGGIAQRSAGDLRAACGLITKEDLASCGPPEPVEPASKPYCGRRFFQAPPGCGIHLSLLFAVIEPPSAVRIRSSSHGRHEVVTRTSSAVSCKREVRRLPPEPAHSF